MGTTKLSKTRHFYHNSPTYQMLLKIKHQCEYKWDVSMKPKFNAMKAKFLLKVLGPPCRSQTKQVWFTGGWWGTTMHSHWGCHREAPQRTGCRVTRVKGGTQRQEDWVVGGGGGAQALRPALHSLRSSGVTCPWLFLFLEEPLILMKSLLPS
jgi:hypothetical protein